MSRHKRLAQHKGEKYPTFGYRRYAAWVIVSGLLVAVMVSPQITTHDLKPPVDRDPADPLRFCYVLVADQSWDCYLEADMLTGHTPVWIGPQSEIKTAHAVAVSGNN